MTMSKSLPHGRIPASTATTAETTRLDGAAGPLGNALYLNKPDYFTITWMAIVHILAVVALFHFTWGGFFCFLLFDFLTGCLGITFCFHRLLTHKSFKAHPIVEGITALFGTLALQGTVQDWVSHHRLHHKASDTERDPHNARFGFWHSHMGWILKSHNPAEHQALWDKYSRDIMEKPWLAFLSKPWVMVASQILLGFALLFIGGSSWVYWGIFLRLAFVYHSTWFVNSATHKWGYRNFRSDDLASNTWWVALVAWGEGWHNNHHRFPNVCPTRYRWWEFDITYVVIKLLQACGLVTDIRTFPKNAAALTLNPEDQKKAPAHAGGLRPALKNLSKSPQSL